MMDKEIGTNAGFDVSSFDNCPSFEGDPEVEYKHRTYLKTNYTFCLEEKNIELYCVELFH